jgi:hypothetical protein
VEDRGLKTSSRFINLLDWSLKELSDGSRSDLAAKAASLGTVVLTLFQPVSLGKGFYRQYISYTLSGIISSGGLLLSFAFHPIYFLSFFFL